jgi:SH3 domain protein
MYRLSAIDDTSYSAFRPDTLRFRHCIRGINMSRAGLVMTGLLFAASAAFGQRLYVTDELVITLRTGPSTQNSIIANLRTGDSVELLEEDEAAGYSRVRVPGSGDEGWVLSRYLMTQPSSDQQLAAAQQELAGAREQITALEAEVTQLSADLVSATSALGAAEDSHQTVRSELEDIREASANVIELQNDNESLRRSNIELSAEVDTLMLEVSRLGSRSQQNWFVVGSLVLAFGIVIGLVAPSLRPRSRSKW